MNRGNSECSKCPTAPFPKINIVVMVTVEYICSTFGGETGLAVRFLLEFLWCIKLSSPVTIHSVTRAAVLEAICLGKL